MSHDNEGTPLTNAALGLVGGVAALIVVALNIWLFGGWLFP